MRSALAFFVLTALAWACSAALQLPSGATVCSERRPCPSGQSCVMGRCRKKATMPVSTDAPRSTFEPADLAWISADGVRGPDEVGETFVLGKRSDRDAMLLMRFAIALPDDARLQRAVISLDPMPQCVRRPGRIEIEVAHVLSPWRSSQLTAGNQPKLGLPMRLAETSATPAKPLRIDVTEIVQAWKEHRKRYHGVALSASGESDSGACYTTGLAYGVGPRLDLYFWPDDEGQGGGGGEGGEQGGAGGAGGEGGSP